MAFEPGSGRRRLPVRPALVACVIGVVGVVATLVIDRGIGDTLANPERAGVAWDIEVYPANPADPGGDEMAAWGQRVAAASDDVAAAAILTRNSIQVRGVGVPALAVRPIGELPAPQITVIEGRSPRVAGEVVLGSATATEAGVGIGDLLRLDGMAYEAQVVGLALFPPEVHSGFDEGVWLVPDDFSSATSGTIEFSEVLLVAELDEGADPDATLSSIQTALGDEVSDLWPPDTPIELGNLRNVRILPIVLAVFLGLLAIASLAHVFATSLRRRARDFAILRSLGMDRRSTRLVVSAQGTAIVVVGLALGVPVGILVGRQGWRWVSGLVPLEFVAPFASWLVLAAIPIALLVVNALAIWPGRRLAHMRLTDHLRTE